MGHSVRTSLKPDTGASDRGIREKSLKKVSTLRRSRFSSFTLHSFSRMFILYAYASIIRILIHIHYTPFLISFLPSLALLLLTSSRLQEAGGTEGSEGTERSEEG